MDGAFEPETRLINKAMHTKELRDKRSSNEVSLQVEIFSESDRSHH